MMKVLSEKSIIFVRLLVRLVFGKGFGLVVRFDRLLARPGYWVFGLSRVFF